MGKKYVFRNPRDDKFFLPYLEGKQRCGGEVYEHLKGNFPKMEVAVQVKVEFHFLLRSKAFPQICLSIFQLVSQNGV